jgi:hypothetical protein
LNEKESSEKKLDNKKWSEKLFSINVKPELIDTELDDIIRRDDIILSITIDIITFLLFWFYAAHQVQSTGFFTATFGPWEMILLYGSLIYWFVTCLFLLVGLKDPSRNLDSFGGLIFVAFGSVWLFFVFPFDYSYIAVVLPEGLQFLVQWMSNGVVARVFLLLGFLVHLFLGRYSGILRVTVLKERARRKNKT